MKEINYVVALGWAVVVLGAAGFLAARARAQSKPDSNHHPAVTIEQVNQWETELSNWGRWGKDDQKGTANLITPAKVKEAAA